MLLASFTAHTLPILANWSQFLGGFTLVGGVGGLYYNHRCRHSPEACWRLAWSGHPVHGRQVCRKHYAADSRS